MNFRLALQFTVAAAVFMLLVIPVQCAPTSAGLQEWSPGLHTFTVAGKGASVLNRYKEAVLLDHDGSGSLSSMWFGGEWPGFEKTVVRVYVDGESTPSIEMQIGMGDGVGFGDVSSPWGSQKLGKTGSVSGVYDLYRIPYGKNVRVTAQRSSDSPDGAPFWWIVRGTDGLRVSIGGIMLPESARLKLYTVENYTAQPLEQVTMCDAKGPGAVYEVAIAAKGLTDTGGWHAYSFMEGCIRGYFDGSLEPELLSSGFEDFFTGTYYFQSGKFANALAGVTHLDNNAREVSAYRFFDDDPLFFSKELRLTCRNGETEHGTLKGGVYGGPPNTTYTTYVWTYQWPTFPAAKK